MRDIVKSFISVFFASIWIGVMSFSLVACRGSGPDDDYCPECTLDSGADAAADAGMDAAGLPCNNACGGTTPYCEEVADECVACLDNAHCTLTVAARCEQSTHTCAGCTADSDCERFTDTPVCDETSGACVECTLDTQEAQCTETQACDTNFVCKTDSCRPCTADSECLSTHRCIPMLFGTTMLPDGYCLQVAPTQDNPGSCLPLRPYDNFLSDRESISSTATMDYCGPTTTTTCQAVLDLMSGKDCPNGTDEECGLEGLTDGLCETIGTENNQCTYICGDDTECPEGINCSSGYCGGP